MIKALTMFNYEDIKKIYYELKKRKRDISAEEFLIALIEFELGKGETK